jgi:glycosyltransferase involved in cell wall biosynthesis
MRHRLAIFADYPEEGWLSMDLAAEMLVARLRAEHADRFEVARLCPPFKRHATWMPLVGAHRYPSTFDRLVNRLRDYPRYARDVRQQYDLFHVADHSYAALVHALPPERTGVFCHDLDAFRAALDPRGHPRPRWYRALARHVLRGMQRAAVVFHATRAVRRQIEALGLIDPARLVLAPLAAADEFVPDEHTNGRVPRDPAVVRAADAANRGPFLLHVGSCAPRKRIDVLLDVVARARRDHPSLRLVKVGGDWSPEQLDRIARLDLAPHIDHLSGLDRASVAWLYRRARAVLMPSEAEGFGLPVVEALACGAPVIASDIPVLREVGAGAVTYAPLADADAWSAAVAQHLADPHAAPPRAARLRRAAEFSWSAHAAIIAGAYERLLHHPRPAPA